MELSYCPKRASAGLLVGLVLLRVRSAQLVSVGLRHRQGVPRHVLSAEPVLSAPQALPNARLVHLVNRVMQALLAVTFVHLDMLALQLPWVRMRHVICAQQAISALRALRRVLSVRSAQHHSVDQ